MPAIDTIASFQTTVASTYAAGVMAPGDSATIRNFPGAGGASLVDVFSDHVTSVQPFRVRSPLLHDNVQGLRFFPGETPSEGLLPKTVAQRLFPQDTLTFELSTAAATGKALAALLIYYDQLPGAMARLFGLGDVAGLIENLKMLPVSIASGANTAGQWLDTILTDEESLLHANTDYAVLGFGTDVGVACIAVKGIDTGNLRVGGPGVVEAHVTNDYFARLSQLTGKPCIPVINSANIGASYLSIISSAATAAIANPYLVLAELSQNLS